MLSCIRDVAECSRIRNIVLGHLDEISFLFAFARKGNKGARGSLFSRRLLRTLVPAKNRFIFARVFSAAVSRCLPRQSGLISNFFVCCCCSQALFKSARLVFSLQAPSRNKLLEPSMLPFSL